MEIQYLLILLCLHQAFSSPVIMNYGWNRLKRLTTMIANLKSPSIRDAECTICTLIVEELQSQVKDHGVDPTIFEFAEELCVSMEIEDQEICHGIVQNYGPQIATLLANSKDTPPDFCGIFIKNCGSPNNPVLQMWSINIPGNKPPVRPWPSVPNGGKTLRVLHLSDIHLDWNYTVGADAVCTHGKSVMNTMCCRHYKSDDPSKPIKMPAGEWGMAQQCDIPYRTFANAMEHISKTEKLDYIMVTGDLEGHDVWNYSKDKTIANIQNITATLTEFFPTTPIYQATGNHEGVPTDSMPPRTIPDYDVHSPEWLYKQFAQSWSPHLTNQALNDIEYRASYAVYIQPRLRLISLNSVYCSEWNFLLYLNVVDPDGTLEWLIEMLVDAEAKGEKVHIMSHIPPGDEYCIKGWSHNFYDIVNRFENTISAIFYGHTHRDQFEVFYESANPNGRPTHYSWIAPSLTTSEFQNPAYRIYTIDGAYSGSSYTVLDAETFYADVEEANNNNHPPIWQLEYKTKEAYGMKDLSPQSWHDLIQRLSTDDELFMAYHERFYRNANYNANCVKNNNCKNDMICSMKTARSYDKDNLCA